MVKDNTEPSPAARWAIAAAGIRHDEEEPAVQEPKPNDGRKRLHPPRKEQDAAHAAADARLVAQMQERIQREQQEKRALRIRLMQQQAQQQAPPVMPQPNPAVIRQAIQQAQRVPQAPPRPPQRYGIEKLAAAMSTGAGICRSWQKKKKQRH
jgi:hypothetical protein